MKQHTELKDFVIADEVQSPVDNTVTSTGSRVTRRKTSAVKNTALYIAIAVFSVIAGAIVGAIVTHLTH